MDTAVKTAKTGYLTRRVGKFLESMTVAYDKSVRTSNNDIVTWVYGGDGFCGEHLEEVPLPPDDPTWTPNGVVASYLANVYACKRALDDDVRGGIFVPKDARRIRMVVESGEAGGSGVAPASEESIARLTREVGVGPVQPLIVHLEHALLGAEAHVRDMVASRFLQEAQRARVEAGYMPGIIAAQSRG